MLNRKSLPLALALAGLSGAAFAVDHAPIAQSGAFDMAIADEHKLIEMLQKSGKISKDASLNDAEVALRGFLKERQEAERKRAGLVDMDVAAKFNMAKGKSLNNALMNGKGNKLGQAKKNRPANVMDEAYNGQAREGRVLAILMEFPDFPHNSINPEDTGMYYADYNQAHYQEILFGDSGWTAPNGHEANSFTQYYQEQSGGSYSVTGDVAGWYMASKDAAYYGNNIDGNARALVMEALTAASADPTVDLTQFDIEDRFDLDGDGDYWEADGLVDHVMIFHSSVGEEAGGGQLGEDAIWAHRWNLGGIFPLGTPAEVPYWGGNMGAYDYTIAPIDAAVGVISHEYGHDLGLPDEYDTQYSGRGEPVSSWSLMSAGSWAGRLGGTEPTGFSAWAKEQLQGSMGGNWLHGATVNLEDLTSAGFTGLLDEASSKGVNNDAIRINLPEKKTVIAQPTSGQYAYFSGSDNGLFNAMGTLVDLSTVSSAKAKFKVWYDIETDWDYAYVYAISSTGVTFLTGNITTDTNPNGQNRGNAITGNSNGWVDAEFDLSAFAGETIELYIAYETDNYVVNLGMYVDDIIIEADGAVIGQTDADEHDSLFTMFGFTKSEGFTLSEHYYLVEWRTHNGIDSGLGHINIAGENMAFEQGMLIWYVDNMFSNNWVGIHPGDGFLGVVDADRHTNTWSDNSPASTRYQIHDATFGLDKADKMHLDLKARYGIEMRDNFTKRNPQFDDSVSFISNDIPDAGRNVPNYGLKVRVTSQSKDGSVGQILIHK